MEWLEGNGLLSGVPRPGRADARALGDDGTLAGVPCHPLCKVSDKSSLGMMRKRERRKEKKKKKKKLLLSL